MWRKTNNRGEETLLKARKRNKLGHIWMAIKPTPASRNVQEKNMPQNSTIFKKKASISSSKVYFNSDSRDTNQLEEKQSSRI